MINPGHIPRKNPMIAPNQEGSQKNADTYLPQFEFDAVALCRNFLKSQKASLHAICRDVNAGDCWGEVLCMRDGKPPPLFVSVLHLA